MSQMDNGDSMPSQSINDEEKKAQNATIARIQRYRDDLAECQLLFAQNELSREISEDQQHRAYHQLAKGFLQLMKPYLEDSEIPQSGYYWEEIDLGGFTIDPPGIIQVPSRDAVETALRVGRRQTLARADPRNDVEPRRYSVKGLRDFAAARTSWEEEWRVLFGPEVSAMDLRSEIQDPRVHVEPRSHRNEPITVVREARVPRQIIDSVVTALENFVRDLGLDIEFEPEPYMGEGGPGL